MEDVGGNIGVLESVGLGDETASVREASNDEDGLVTVLDGERTEDGMTLYDLVLGDLLQKRSAITSAKGDGRKGRTSTPSSLVSFCERAFSMVPPPLVTQMKGNLVDVLLLPVRI